MRGQVNGNRNRVATIRSRISGLLLDRAIDRSVQKQMRKGRRYVRVLRCASCGGKMYATGRESRKRATGHIKHMYCPYCKSTKPFIEQGEWE